MSAQFACFVTGTDTEIGKTLIASALVHALGQLGPQAGASYTAENFPIAGVHTLLKPLQELDCR